MGLVRSDTAEFYQTTKEEGKKKPLISAPLLVLFSTFSALLLAMIMSHFQVLSRGGGNVAFFFPPCCLFFQGDEPLIEPEIIDRCVEALQSDPNAVYSTPCTELSREEATQRQRVKVIMDKDEYAIYFSRGLLPHNKDGVPKDFRYWLHLGLQCYDANFIKTYARLPETPLMLEEDLEQLKVLENGYKIKMIKVDHSAHGVDKPEDIESIIKIMQEKGIQ